MIEDCIILFVLTSIVTVYGYPGDTIMLQQPFEVRNVDRYPYTPQFNTGRNTYSQPLLHTNMVQESPNSSSQKPSSENITFNDLMEAYNEVKATQHKEKESSQFRTSDVVERDNHGPAYHPYPGSYSPPSSPGYSTPSYQKPTAVSAPPAPVIPKVSLKPDLSTLFKPVTTKVSSKVSGLLGLILALFSGSSLDGLQTNGLKDLIIDGIIKPLLVAKGGIKTLISKLTLPVISLLLINLEVLITIWWLWEDCGVQQPPVLAPTYTYPKPTYNNNNNYNNYNSYR